MNEGPALFLRVMVCDATLPAVHLESSTLLLFSPILQLERAGEGS
jgi:hypothetical protein